MSIQVVILAAGQGTRMCSDKPKVLHTLAGKPLLAHVIETAKALSSALPIVIHGHQGDKVQDMLSAYPVKWVHQREQLGTGHAVLQALPHIPDDALVLVLSGDVPLISVETLKELIKRAADNAVGMVTVNLQHPKGYGRIKREQGKIIGIVEEKDATTEERCILEINAGIYLVPAVYLKKWLKEIKNDNAQGEYYLPDIILHAVSAGVSVQAVQPAVIEEVLGVNDRVQLAQLERFYQQQQAEAIMRKGATLADPSRVDIRGEVTVGRDVTIDVNVIFEGKVVIGDHCTIGPNTLLRNVTIGSGVTIKANSVITDAGIGDGCVIGPFAHIRPGTVLDAHAHIGNFVEIKKSHIGSQSKVNHLSYIGDSDIGKRVNVGAGTITCNYDGVAKHITTIHDDAFIGSCTQLVAPVIVGQGATIGAGSTITQDAPAHKLTLSRTPQTVVKDWVRPTRKEKI